MSGPDEVNQGVTLREAMLNDAVKAAPLGYLPVALFGSAMGLTALAVAWRLAHVRFGVPEWISDGIAALAVLAFVLMVCGYAVKIVAAPDAVMAEYNHPITANLFGTFLISLVLLPMVLAPVSLALAQCLWLLGATGMVVFSGVMINHWLTARQLAEHATPAWFVPVVGMLDVPLAYPALGMPWFRDLMLVGLAVGGFFVAPLFTLVFSRLLFEPPIPAPLQPMLLILLAPFAVGTSAYISITGQVDLFAQCTYMLTLFMLAVLGMRLRHLPQCCPFRVSWWSVSFPLAATAIAALRIADAEKSLLADGLAGGLLAGATIVVAALLFRTAVGVARGELAELSA